MVTGRWIQPNFVPHCLHASGRAIWDGIGGFNSNKLIQAGSITTDFSGQNINKVSAFVEVVPAQPAQLVPSPAIRSGDAVTVQNVYTTASGGTGTCQTF
jgi:hypothetical protein